MLFKIVSEKIITFNFRKILFSVSGSFILFSFINNSAFAVPDPIAEVNDGSTIGVDIDYTVSTTQLSANWPETSDRDYGIAKYWYGIGTTPGATDVTSGWIDNGLSLTVDYAGTFSDGQIYYFTVKAENDIAEQSTPTNSDGQTVDISAPVLTLNTVPDPIASGYVTITLGSNEPLVETESEDPPGTGILATVQQNAQPSSQTIILTATGNPNEWEGTYTVDPVYTGTADVSVSVTDFAGNPQTGNDTFTVNAPAANLTVTLDPAIIGSGGLTVDIQSSAGLSATPAITVDQAGLTLAPTTPIYSTGTNQWRAVYTIDSTGTYDGTGTVTVDAVDLSLNAIQEIENFTADSTPPTDISFVSTPPGVVSGINADFEWTSTTDATSGVLGYSYVFTQTNPPPDPDNIVELPDGFTTVNFGSLLEGTYYFKIKPVDNAGNAGSIIQYSFVVDNQSPALTVDAVPDLIGVGSLVTITVSSDEPLSAAPTVTVQQNGQPAPVTVTPMTPTGNPDEWSGTYLTIASYDGLATVTADGTDLGSNPAPQATTTFTVDSNAPVFTITVDPAVVAADDVTITVTSDKPLQAAPTVTAQQNGQGSATAVTVTPTGVSNQWEGTYTAVTGFDGQADVNANGIDLAGNPGAGTANFDVDTTDPTADILIYPIDAIGGSVTGGAATTLATGPYRIELTVTDASAVSGTPILSYTLSTTVYNLTLTSAGGSVWTSDIFIESTMPNDTATFDFSAIDAAGNTGTAINSGGTFTVDTVITNTVGGTTQNSDGSQVTTPAGAYTGNYYISIAPANQLSLAIVTANNTSGVVPVTSANSIREFTVRTAPPPGTVITDFTLPSAAITITIPYPDTNDDGIVDGTNILETSLRIFYLNEILNRWEAVTPYTLDAVNNFISAQVSHLSIYGLLGIGGGAALSNIVVYPNPCYMKRDGFVTITNIPPAGSASLYIYNLGGQLVRKLEDGSGITSTGLIKQAVWDGRNSSGQKCASGMYVYLLKANGGKKKGKIGIFW